MFTGPGTLQPVNVSVNRDQSAVFSALAVGSAPMRYQWIKEGGAVPGATESTLRIPAAQLIDAGRYSLTASNAFGTATSAQASLTVNTVPVTITQQPKSVSAALGSTVTFEVVATGTNPISYQIGRAHV
mgnify:CR=1 FL=1